MSLRPGVLRLNKEVVVLVPAYNEEKRIEDTISALGEVSEVDEVIVINDGSTDRTAEIAGRTEARLINLKANCGKGAALNEGLKAADGEIISLIDGDLGTTATEVKKLLAPVLKGEVDMSIARFPPPEEKGGFGLVLTLAQLGLKFFTGRQFASPLSGQRVLNKELVNHLEQFESGFGVEIAMTIQAVKGGFKVKEVPVQMNHYETGRDLSGFKHRGKQFKDVLFALGKQIRGERR